MTDAFNTRLERWKRALIDLTKRNRLLNYNPSRLSTIQVVNEIPAEVFRSLQLEGKSLKFLPTQNNDEIPLVRKDKFLQTSSPEEKLNDSLLRIYRKSVSLFEEQGISTLFVALGMLEWHENDEPEVLLKAPLLLLPAELTRKLAWQDFSLKTTGDDPVINPALVEQLRLSFELILPELPENLDEFDLEKFFADVQEIISKQKNWRLRQDIFLDFFSFQKFLMYKDMERYQQHYYDNTLIQALCNVNKERMTGLPEHIEKADLDHVLSPDSTFHVLDADSSQQRAILAVKSQHDLIIEGPPGTGKSQTIANLIADALADGKTILFVSEKIAALEVVYKRLQTIGLHDFCLELHSHKTNKRAVYDEFMRVLDNTRPIDHAKDADLTQLGDLRDLLNKYARELHTPFGNLGQKPFDVLGQLSLVLGKAPLIQATIPNINNVDQVELQQTCSQVQELVQILGDLGDPKRHPWYASQLRNISNAELAGLNEALAKIIKAYDQLINESCDFADEIGILTPISINQINTVCEAAIAIASSPGVHPTILADSKWDTMPIEAQDIINHGHNLVSLQQKILTSFKPEVMDIELADICQRFSNYSQSWTRFIKADYWQDRKFLLNYLLPQFKHLPVQSLAEQLSAIQKYQIEKTYLESQNAVGESLFASRWQGLHTSWKNLQQYAEWLVLMRQYINAGILGEKALNAAATGNLDLKKTRKMVLQLQEQIGYLVAALQELIAQCEFSEKYIQRLNADNNIEEARDWLAYLLGNIQKLHQTTVYNDKLAICLSSIAGPMTKTFLEQGYDPAVLEKTFKRFFYERWLDLVFLERPRLAAFNSLIHEQKIDDFRILDFKSIKLSRQRLLHRLYAKREMAIANPILSMELGTLQRELRKKARHIPLRKLFSKVPSITSAIKPCFMMSPMSAALFLDPSVRIFDLVIFDEASQVPTEDAVGSLVRAKQAVVVGDPKQLPPTNFFQMQILQADEQASDEDSILDDVDSVLDEFVSVGFPKQSLLWHYRSQHESLIEFSNRHFYKNLLTFPAPHNGTDELGLQFHFVGGIYKGLGINPIEAKAVADAVCEHIRKHPELSLGVGTFNMNQQQLILDELEQRRREDPELEFFFAKKGEDQFFVKNLENIQGDERDVIFISITYGPDEAGNIRYNFGPVNGENGWRRLNVIFTRAKLCLKVFSSMRGEQIDPIKVQSQGAKLLREFLIFAEKRPKDLVIIDSEASIENPFERSVYNELTKRGVRLIPDVGQSGYHIDFGVVDDSNTKQFLLGIECDGINYNSASTARDRDRLRQQVLTNLGWTIIRIWSIDWWRDKEAQIQKVLKHVSQARLKPSKPIDLAQTVSDNLDKAQSTSIEFDETKIPQQTFDPAIQEVTAPVRIFGKTNPAKETNQAGNNKELSVPPYKLTLLSPYGNAEDFANASNQQLKEALERVLLREVPIHTSEAMKRVVSFWEITRLNKQIKEKLENIIRELAANNQIIIKDDFIWGPNEQKSIVRNRQGLDYVFDPDFICQEEYEQAITMILEAYGTRIKDSMSQDVARLLGFSRTGQKITQRVSQIIQNFIDGGKITNVATGLALANLPAQQELPNSHIAEIPAIEAAIID